MLTNKELLKKHYDSVEKIILSKQDPITGLLPASTAITAHGDYTDAWVRDNVYSILSVWGLALAYKKDDVESVKGYELSQSVVKLMRGLLVSMMRQSDRVEKFKQSLDPLDALHAKYGTKTGLAVVGDDEWGHLQLDATSLFLLMLAQMITSGLKIIYTKDEVDFVQNLVHYISHTYSVPDYGIWERGNKINHGTTEINASSVGMAKAALEVMDGFNLYGTPEASEGAIYVVMSDITRTCSTLESLLPRESLSKETDAALLSIIGYPAYAVENEELLGKTYDKIVKKLVGNYGCKRFLLDGHQSSIEDSNRLHYEPSELRAFEEIESEWPLFFTYLLLDAVMKEETDAIAHWSSKLEPLFVEEDGERLLPELYIVPKESVEAEKQNPGSQKRVANENIPLVWAQSLYMLSNLIMDGLLQTQDIDPLERRKNILKRRGSKPLVSIISQNDSVQKQLLDVNIYSQTLQQLSPMKVMHAKELAKFHTKLGENKKLGLSGRKEQVMRTISTASVYEHKGENILFLPYYFDPQDFYFSSDYKLLMEHFIASLRYISKSWKYQQAPILLFFVKEEMLEGSLGNVVLEFLKELQLEKIGDVNFKLSSLLESLKRAHIVSLDYVTSEDIVGLTSESFYTSTNYLAVMKKDENYLTSTELNELEHTADAELVEFINSHHHSRVRSQSLRLLWQRHDKNHFINFENEMRSLYSIAEQFYIQASASQNWAVVRCMADLLKKYDERLEDALLDIVIRQKRLAVGRAYSVSATLSKPTNTQEIVQKIDNFCGNNRAESVLTQELILFLGDLIRFEPALFKDILTLRTWSFVQYIVGQISREKSLSIADAYEHLLDLSPSELLQHLYVVLKSFALEKIQIFAQENLHVSGIENINKVSVDSYKNNLEGISDWLVWRKQVGLVGSLPEKFYKDVWYLLQQCNALVIGDKYNLQSRISSEDTHDSTAGEKSFALRVDDLLQAITVAEYLQVNIEVIESLAYLFRQSPQLHVSDDLVLDVLIGHAVRLLWQKNHPETNYDEMKSQAWETFYQQSPKLLSKAFIEAFIYLMHDAQKQENVG